MLTIAREATTGFSSSLSLTKAIFCKCGIEQFLIFLYTFQCPYILENNFKKVAFDRNWFWLGETNKKQRQNFNKTNTSCIFKDKRFILLSFYFV